MRASGSREDEFRDARPVDGALAQHDASELSTIARFTSSSSRRRRCTIASLEIVAAP